MTHRRELLAWSAALAASVALRSRSSAARSDARQRTSPRPVDVEELVRWIVTTPREPALRRGARELESGLEPATLLGALLVAAAREVRTDRPKFNHAALCVSSIEQLTRSAPADERRRDALWCLDFFKESQEFETGADDWRMAPVETAQIPGRERARAALVDALEHWDAAAADVAVAGCVRSLPLEDVYAVVWEYGTRCSASLGHKAIHAALSRRALPLAGDAFAEDVLRSVVSSFVRGASSRDAATFERSRELATRGIVVRAPKPAADPGASRELLAAIRATRPAELPDVVAKLIAEGAAHASLWSAVLAAAAEVGVAEPSVGPLHASTSANALRHIALHAPSERVALLALFQAAAWTGEFRARLDERAAAFRLDTLEPAPAEIGEPFDGARGIPAVRRALWLGAHAPERFLDRARELACTKADDVHEFKLAAAAIEEARRVSDWARPFVCAALAAHAPDLSRTDSTRLARISDALAVARAR